MNTKIHAILLKLVRDLQKLEWKVTPDWELNLKMEGHATLVKDIRVQGSIGGEDPWDDEVPTTIDLKLASNDELTFFPEYTIYADISVGEGDIKDVLYKTDNDTAFTDKDFSDDKKIASAANKISRAIEDHIEHEFDEYLIQNGDTIQHKQGSKHDPDGHDDDY